MKKNKQKNKTTYGTLSNFKFMAKRISAFDKSLFFYMPLPMVGQMGLAVLGIFIPKIIIDSLISDVSLANLLMTVAIVALLLIIFQFLLSFSNNKIQGKAMSVRVSIMALSMSKTIVADYQNIASKKGQDKRRKALEATQRNTAGTEAITNESIQLLKNVGGIVIFGAILGFVNPYILVLLIGGAIINILISRRAMKYEHKHKDEFVPLDNKMYYMREQCVDISNAKDIRMYSMGEWLIDMFKGFISQRHDWYKKVEYKKYVPNVVDALIIFLRDGLAYAYLIYQVFNGMPIGDFVLYLGAIMGFSVWLSGASENVAKIKRASLQIEDLRGYLDMEDVSNHGEGLPLPTDENLPCSITFKNVSYRYPDSENSVIENLNMHVEKGEKLAVVGVNGAGKTTIVKLLCGLLVPTDGDILLNGVSIDKYNIKEYQSLFSVAFQDACIMSFTIAENVSMKSKEACDLDKVENALKRAGLYEKTSTLKHGTLNYINNIFTDEGVDLSGGEKQKLVLARALYKDAPMLVLDEPTAALDPIAEANLYNEYAKMTKNKTSVYISHRLSSTRFCDRIVFIEDGKILESGTHDVLMKQGGEYAHMFDVQSHYYAKDKEELS